MLREAGHRIHIHPAPQRDRPRHPLRRGPRARTYTRTAPAPARRLLSADRVFRLFRSGFLGKVSPVHFFWGSFDLAVTRFSGRPRRAIPAASPTCPTL
jgi:hypothetical protein